jgi:hypothetical protein
MLQSKKKICSQCEQEKHIWKNDKGFRFCKECWYKIRSKTENLKINAKSSKRQKQDEEYTKLRKRYLEEHPLCEVKFASNCSHYSTEIHHVRGGEERSAFYLVQSEWKGVCRNCHTEIHLNPEKARKLNYLK